MSKPDTIVFTGPDGAYYEIPSEVARGFRVPPNRVAELRKRLAADSGAAAPGDGAHFRPGDPLPEGVPPPPPELLMATQRASAPSASTTIATPSGGTVVLNFFFGPPTDAGATASASAPSSGVEGYHMSFDANGIPTNHVDLLWGDYVDKQGNPAVGWHSHDPVTGNAQ